MNRRDLLKGATAGAAGVSATLMLGAAPARAGRASYSVIGTEQVQNKLLMWDKDAEFTDENVQWSWSPGVGGWFNLSDVRFRATFAFGEVVLVAASGGSVGIVDKKAGERHQGLESLLWEGKPGGNPHALERIPGLGVMVSASSAGHLNVYAPARSGDPATLAEVQVVELPGAHGVLWDPAFHCLWGIGDKTVNAYQVTGSGPGSRLVDTGRSVALDGLGHDLQPDYTDRTKLLVTDTYGVYRIDKRTLTKATVAVERDVKAYVRHHSGEDVSVRADLLPPKTWGSPTIRFSVREDRTRPGAEFYKARVRVSAYQ